MSPLKLLCVTVVARRQKAVSYGERTLVPVCRSGATSECTLALVFRSRGTECTLVLVFVPG